ncbi:MAG: ABC transporter ATP-binding protein [Gammaproteobacteria bacterium]|nr:ABC transporter ATP-binding protein [Gammaproteobacteria bacterium]
MNQESLLKLDNIVKSYPGCLANDYVSLEIRAGSIHALLGENGAGKSTLVKIIYGVLQADQGVIRWRGRSVRVDSPAVARKLGIAMVFQHFSLFDALTVEDNIRLGLDRNIPADLAGEIRRISARYGLPLDPDRYVYTLSVGERQRIEIVRCLLQQPRLLIMDEPTSVLTPQEVESLFATLRRLSTEGVSILYISHKLDEIRHLCDEATILRDGKVVGRTDPRSESAQSLAAMMIGQDIVLPEQRNRPLDAEVLLELDNLQLTAADSFSVALRDISLQVRSGEILGLAGVAGNGQDELMSAITGERSVSRNLLKINQEPAGHLTPGQRRERGLCCVPEERLGHAAVPGMSLQENAFLTAQHRLPLKRLGFMRSAGSRDFARSVIERFQVQCRSSEAAASSLSGGNLQKFVVGREVMQSPEILVIAQPTWGVDAGAAAAIHDALIQLAAEGAAILVISQDLDELFRISHSLMAICAGRVSDRFPAAELSVEEIGLLMGGMSLNPQSNVTPQSNDGSAAGIPQ